MKKLLLVGLIALSSTTFAAETALKPVQPITLLPKLNSYIKTKIIMRLIRKWIV
jgi:hypothetical protein